MTLVRTNVTSWFERDLRRSALDKDRLRYLNVQLLGLSNRPHPALQNIWSTQDVKKARAHIKFLIDDLPAAITNGTCCRTGHGQGCVTEHLLTKCNQYSEIRHRLLPDLLNVVHDLQPTCKLLQVQPHDVLTQFILDCTSINLQNEFRIPAHNPGVSRIFACSRDWCFAIASKNARHK